MPYTYKIKVDLYNVFWPKMIVRLYYKEKLDEIGQIIELDEKQSHYLNNVLRLDIGSTFFVFDGLSGEYEAEIVGTKKKGVTVKLLKKTREIGKMPDIWLLFAPLKKDKTDMVIQKATELGVSRIVPVQTVYTNSEKVRLERLEIQAIEAAEQCRRVEIPQLAQVVTLDKILENWDSQRILFFLDEKGSGKNIAEVMKNSPKAAIIVGPEGGFSSEEAKKLQTYSFVRSISLGQRILRAETAAIASLSCWQAINGDW